MFNAFMFCRASSAPCCCCSTTKTSVTDQNDLCSWWKL